MTREAFIQKWGAQLSQEQQDEMSDDLSSIEEEAVYNFRMDD